MEIKEILNTVNKYDATMLKLEISGEDISYPFMNALRKTSINHIPIYAFHPSKIIISKNTSVFNNSEMRCHLSQLPIKDIPHKITTLSEKYYKNVNFADPEFVRHVDDTYDINYTFSGINDGIEKVLNIDMNHVKRHVLNKGEEEKGKVKKIGEEEKTHYSEYPILLIQLRGGEEFECSMKSTLGIGEVDAIFDASNTYYEEITENKYIMTVESNGQLTEYDILDKSCIIIIGKLRVIKTSILENTSSLIITEDKSMILEIINEDFICCGPINWVLQSTKGVIYSGVSKPEYMQKRIVVKLKVDKKLEPIKVLCDAIDTCIEWFGTFQKKMNIIRRGEKSKK